MTIKLKKIIALFFLFSCFALLAEAKKEDFTKVEYKEFDISAFGTTNLINKYGKMDVHTWDGGQVKIKVTIVVKANSQSGANDVFNRVKINWYNDANFAKAETQLDDSKGNGGTGSWFDWRSWVNMWDSRRSSSDFSINYDVYMPKGNFLDVSNRYGDTFIGETNGAVKATIKYGNLKTENVNNNMDLYLGYGNATVGNTGNLNGEISYGKLAMRDGKNITLDTKYSIIEIEKANEMRLASKYDTYDIGTVTDFKNNGKYDKFKIREVQNLTLNSAYVNMDIHRLGGFADLDCSYGGLNIQSISKDFTEVRFSGNYFDVRLDVDAGTEYRLDATTNYADIKYPSNFTSTHDNSSGKSQQVEGYLGNKNAKGLIKANLNYGNLKIQ